MSNTPIADALRGIFTGPEKWTTGAFARNKNGISCDPVYEDAQCFCLMGAAVRISYYNEIHSSIVSSAFNRALPNAYYNIAQFNDSVHTTFKDIQALIDKIAEAEQESQSSPT